MSKVSVNKETFEALVQIAEFYGNEDNWTSRESPTHTIIEDDDGMRARDALLLVEDEAIENGQVMHG